MIFFLFITLSTICLSHPHHYDDDLLHDHDDDEHISDTFFYRFHGTETINGVAPYWRIYWMLYAMQTRINAYDSPCPADGFGAVIVNRTTNQLLCQTNLTTRTSSVDHAEMHLLVECAAYFNVVLFPGAGTNKAVWADCSLYTTGESCPMCQSGQVWTGVGETIYSTTIETLAINRHQILIRSKKVVAEGIPGGINPPLTLISFVDTSYTDPYFAWQNTTAPCPGGCIRNMANVCVPPS
jgi:tRNA(Arg) A34 adenosine deaminase TadA